MAPIEDDGKNVKIFDAARIYPLGDTALTLVFGESVDVEINARVMRAVSALCAARIPGVTETVPTFASLTVHFDPAAMARDELIARIGALSIPAGEAAGTGRVREIPVLYDGADLADVAEESGLTPDGVRDLHAGTEYHVYMLGFLPGFAYLGDLPERLRLARLKEPRIRVPAGAVAIAGPMTAVYPSASPGGWRLIGRTPFVLFDHRADPPNLLAPGDTVRFRAIGADEFHRLSESVS